MTYRNILGLTLILVQAMGPRLLGYLGGWGAPSAAPASASSIWCPGWGEALDPCVTPLEASIQPPTHLFLKCLRVSGALVPTVEGHCQGEMISEPHCSISSKFLYIVCGGVVGRGRDIGDSSSLTFWSTKIARNKRSCRIKPMVSNAEAGFTSGVCKEQKPSQKHFRIQSSQTTTDSMDRRSEGLSSDVKRWQSRPCQELQ